MKKVESQKPATPTLDDVARLAGVSSATVSRSLNKAQLVNDKTRARVLQAIDTLGYSPNFGARAMAAKRTMTIGAVIPTMANAIFARGLQAFEEELGQRGYTMLVASSGYDPEKEDRQIRALVSRGAEGILLIGHDRGPGVLRFLKTQNVPAIAIWAHDAEAVLPSIGFDNARAMQSMAEHVISYGHREIAIISAHIIGNDRARARLNGAQAALAQAGLEPARVVETTYSIEHGRQALSDLLMAKPEITAVICGNDVLAVGAVLEARAQGLSVPGHLSVTGFDDLGLARVVEPPLTTIQVPHAAMGRKAAEALVEMIDGAPEPAKEELDVRLKIRCSLGTPHAL